ncbi:hypothetical protein Tco_0194627 [Tanacetum coccineum]
MENLSQKHRLIDRATGGKLRNKNAKESWALLEDLTLYENESWNDPRDFAKTVKAIALPQDVLSTSDHRLIKLENQVQCLMEAHLASTQPTQVNKVTTSCEICSGPHDTRITWKILNKPLSNTHPRVTTIWEIGNSPLTKDQGISIKPPTPGRTNQTLNIIPEHGHNITKEAKDKVKEVIDEEESEVETDEEIEEILENEEEDEDGEYFNSFSTMEELTHHEWLLKNPRPPFAYECDFMILEDTTSIIDRHLGEMAFGRPSIDEIGLIFLDYLVTLGFGSTGGLDLACPIIRLSCQYGIHQVIRYVLGIVGINHCNLDILPPIRFGLRTMAGVDVDTLVMEQYLALSRDNQAPGVVKPKIEGNVNFEIKSQFMRELREETFSGNKDEDSHDHIDRVLSIVGLFNILGVSKDAVML